jgi:hypothetical protein
MVRYFIRDITLDNLLSGVLRAVSLGHFARVPAAT